MPRHPQDIAGNIRVTLTPGRAHIGAVEIVSTRPLEPARIFEGRTVDAMTAAIGRVFSLCGTAQTVAALDAAEAALGCPPDRAVAAARSLHAARSMPWKYSPPVSIARREDGANGDGAVQPIPPSPDAARQTIFTSRAFDFDSPVLGRRMLSMPSLKWASTLLPSTLSGSEKRREKLP